MLLWFTWDLPRPEAALDAARRPSLTLEDRTGQVFATFGDVVGDPLRLSDMPRVSSRRGGRRRGPALLAPPRARLPWYGPCGTGEPASRTRGAGRLDDHPAGGEEPVPHQRPHLSPQGAGVAADAMARAQLLEAGNSRDLAEPGLSRRRRVGSRRCGADVFRGLGPTPEPLAGGGHCRLAPRAFAFQPARRSRRRRRPREGRARRDGGHGRNHGARGRACGGADRIPAAPGRRFRMVCGLGRRPGATVAAARRGRRVADDARYPVADARRDEAGRAAGRAGRGRRGRAGGGRRAGCRERGGTRDGRRQRLPAKLLQSGGARSAAARLVVQAVRLVGGAGERRAAGRHGAGCAGSDRRLESLQFRAPLSRRDHGGGGACPIHQHGRRSVAARRRRPAAGGGRRPAARDCGSIARQCVARARHRRGRVARTHRGLCGILQRRRAGHAVCDRGGEGGWPPERRRSRRAGVRDRPRSLPA